MLFGFFHTFHEFAVGAKNTLMEGRVLGIVDHDTKIDSELQLS